MTGQDTQERPIPNVPEGTPGRDWRAELPAALPQGPQQPWRRHGPGSRTWVVVVTAIAAVLVAILGIFAVSYGFATTAFERHGVVALDRTEYTATSESCAGAGEAAGVRDGARVEFRGGGERFGAELGTGQLRSGRCLFPFTLSALRADRDVNYAVTVGGVPATPVAGAELASTSGTVIVYLR